jgi:hypothetical protein
MSRSLLLVALVVGLIAGTSGCAVGSGTPESMPQRVIQAAVPDEVLAAAAQLLKREFGRVRIERGSRVIDAGPLEYTTERDSGTARDLVGGRSTMRRVANFGVSQVGGNTLARLRVDLERRDTERQMLMRPHAYRLSDNPGQETPLDADAATSSQQNTVWTRVRRDRALERALLDELREQFAARELETAPAPEVPSGTPPAPATAPGSPVR